MDGPFLSLSAAWHLRQSLDLASAFAASTSTAAEAGVILAIAKTVVALAREMENVWLFSQFVLVKLWKPVASRASVESQSDAASYGPIGDQHDSGKEPNVFICMVLQLLQ